VGDDAGVVLTRRHEATAELWQETYLSALLRAIRYADDASYRLAGYRKLDPITTPEAEIRFLQTAEELFFKGGSGAFPANHQAGNSVQTPRYKSRPP
jgi:hypothetical protein